MDERNPKSDPSIDTHTKNVISDTDTNNVISTQTFYPLFIKPAIRAVVRPIETRSRASCGSPSFAVTSVSPTLNWEPRFFSPSNFSTARRGRKSEPFGASIGLSSGHTVDKLQSIFVPATRVGGLTDNSGGLTSRHGIAKVAADRVSEEKAYSEYIKSSEFETMKVF